MAKRYRIKSNSSLVEIFVQVDLNAGSWESPTVRLTKEETKVECDLTTHLNHPYYSQHIEEVKKPVKIAVKTAVEKNVQSIAPVIPVEEIISVPEKEKEKDDASAEVKEVEEVKAAVSERAPARNTATTSPAGTTNSNKRPVGKRGGRR